MQEGQPAKMCKCSVDVLLRCIIMVCMTTATPAVSNRLEANKN